MRLQLEEQEEVEGRLKGVPETALLKTHHGLKWAKKRIQETLLRKNQLRLVFSAGLVRAFNMLDTHRESSRRGLRLNSAWNHRPGLT